MTERTLNNTLMNSIAEQLQSKGFSMPVAQPTVQPIDRARTRKIYDVKDLCTLLKKYSELYFSIQTLWYDETYFPHVDMLSVRVHLNKAGEVAKQAVTKLEDMYKLSCIYGSTYREGNNIIEIHDCDVQNNNIRRIK